MSYPRILLRLGLGTPPSALLSPGLHPWVLARTELVPCSLEYPGWAPLPSVLPCHGRPPPQSPPDSPLPPKNNTDKVPILISLSLLFISLSK